jgi:uncharacterized protein YqeY
MALYDAIVADFTKDRMARGPLKNEYSVLVMRLEDILKKKGSVSDDDAVRVVRKQAKEVQDSLEFDKKAHRQDLIDSDTRKLNMLSRYLPTRMTEAQLTDWLAQRGLYRESKINMGNWMKFIKSELGEKADGRMASTIIKNAIKSLK